MSKARIMGAASSGYNYGVNKNSPGNGNGKWQGLWPSVGHARNARLINTRAGGNNRNVVFCMNQLGGVGRKSNMFATTADGVKQPCPGSESLNPFGAAALAAVRTLQAYLKAKYNGKGSLILVGKKETLTSDNVDNPQLFEPIKHFYPGTQEYKELPVKEQQAAEVLNALQIRGPLQKGGPSFLHVAGFATLEAQIALRAAGYGKNIIKFGPNVQIRDNLFIGDAVDVFAWPCFIGPQDECFLDTAQFGLKCKNSRTIKNQDGTPATICS